MILQGIWFDATFHLWGFGSARDLAAPGEQPAEAVATPARALLLPNQLHAAAGELTPDGLLASIAIESTLALWLPAVADAPIDSESTVDPTIKPTLARFEVPALAFAPAEAIDLLSALAAPFSRTCGVTLQYWARLAHFVQELLSRRQFVPDLRDTPGARGAVEAWWRVLLRDELLLKRIERYTAQMPPACRAVANVETQWLEPQRLVESFIEFTADAVIRRHLMEDEFFHQIHERAAEGAPAEVVWLSALMREDRTIQLPADAASALRQNVRGWVGRVVEPATTEPPSIGLELIEPAVEPSHDETADPPRDPAPWRIRFLLSTPNKGMVDLEHVWRDDAMAGGLLRSRHVSHREHILAELARAADVCPLLADALRDSEPTELHLTNMQAFAFLRDHAALLEARGFAVRLPEWAIRPERQLGLRLDLRPARHDAPISVSTSRLGLHTLVDFEWRVAIGDQQLSFDDFERLRKQNAPLVRIGREWLFLDPEHVAQAAEFLEEHQSGRMSLQEALRRAAGAETTEVGLPVVGLNGAEWLERLLAQSPAARLETAEQPAGFEGSLRPYQLRGLSWLTFLDNLGIGACLADDMGLGKTVQLIALLLRERQNGSAEEPGPTLIFAPMSVVGNWKREIERFSPQIEVLVHHGSDRLDSDAFIEAARQADAVVTTYALGHRDLDILRKVDWHRIVLDEAQKIKNPSAAQTIAIRSIASPRRIALTGTPLENHLSELWSIMEMLNPGLLGSAASFRQRFAVPIERLGDQPRAERLRRMIRPFMLRRIKTDPDVECDLPEKMEMRVYCNLTPEQAALYEHTVASTLAEVESASGIRRRGMILAALTRLKQICNHPTNLLRDGGVLDGRSGKCERLVEMLEEVIAEGDSALVFTQFREMGDLLVSLLGERLREEIPFLHGGVNARKRQAMIDAFQDAKNGPRIFLLSLRAGGLGLNLTKANHVFHFDRWWNPAVEDQATDRAHRIGQVRRVQVHKFVCIGTIEDRIDRLLTEKLALADRIVGSGDEWIVGLSTDELRDYLALSKEAVA